MPDPQPLTVDTNTLVKLGNLHDQASGDAGSAATAASGIGKSAWVSHGVVCGASNVALTKAEDARRAAGEAMENASKAVTKKLGASARAYEGADAQAADNIDKQVLDGGT